MSASRPAPRPKRGGEEFARTHYLDADGPSSKKPRFDVRNPSALAPDAPEEDAILDADEIGKRGQQTKRNAVNIDGYESDSSNEGFDARADVKAKEAKQKGTNGTASAMEEEHDMFADVDDGFRDADEDEEALKSGKKLKKDVRFLDEDEIEGQVAGSRSGGHVSADFAPNHKGGTNGRASGKQRERDAESSSESDVDEEERAYVPTQLDEELGAGGKKEHAPKLDAFNMKAEQEEGRFDAQGNFVRKAADPDAVHDSWLEGVSKKDMKKAKEAAEKRDEERRQKAIADDAVLTSDVLKTLIPYLERGETVLEALARLGRGKAKKKLKWQNKNKSKRAEDDGMDVDAEKPAEDPAEIRRREAVEAITGAADQLLTRGQSDVYDAEREVLMRQYRRETGEDWVDPPREEASEDAGEGHGEVKQWDYRWSDARDGGEAHGPYDGAMMVSWNDAGYFGDGVEFRRAGDEGAWSRSVDFV
ncbi:MAG: lin1 family [Lasallia pustulata]|uniref:Lin1 family n=1 Tax=Lasallia pustulata TaxID=136370 RepID=A0A5M8PJZ5_9LECA|nr:MAG: lin1 family [Lasallia pustulata]